MSDHLNCADCSLRELHAGIPDTPESTSRRVILSRAAGLMAGAAGLIAAPALAKFETGDRLVLEDAEGTPMPLRVQDIPAVTKPILAFPYSAASKTIRNDSRLNKIVLLRFAESDLDAETRKRSAKGVLAFSAICTHQACDVKTWISKDKALVCFCHSSQFLPLEQARVNGGPAPRALPSLPLSEEGGQLVIAGPFSSKPGAST